MLNTYQVIFKKYSLTNRPNHDQNGFFWTTHENNKKHLYLVELPWYNKFAQINWRCAALQDLHQKLKRQLQGQQKLMEFKAGFFICSLQMPSTSKSSGDRGQIWKDTNLGRKNEFLVKKSQVSHLNRIHHPWKIYY